MQAMSAAVRCYESSLLMMMDLTPMMAGMVSVNEGDAYDTTVTTPVNADDYCVPNTIILLLMGSRILTRAHRIQIMMTTIRTGIKHLLITTKALPVQTTIPAVFQCHAQAVR